jgi:hypothetical protein
MQTMGHSDAAKRLYDTYNIHRIALGNGAIGRWFAAALADGRSDDVLYDNKRDCVIHQHHDEDYYTYIKIIPPSMKLCDAEVMLKTARNIYNAGMRVADPDDRNGGKDVIKRLSIEDQRNQSVGINSNLIMPWEN